VGWLVCQAPPPKHVRIGEPEEAVCAKIRPPCVKAPPRSPKWGRRVHEPVESWQGGPSVHAHGNGPTGFTLPAEHRGIRKT